MKLLECTTLLPILVKVKEELDEERSVIAFLDLSLNQIYFAKPILATSGDEAPFNLVKEEILARYYRKPIERPNMPENGWNR